MLILDSWILGMHNRRTDALNETRRQRFAKSYMLKNRPRFINFGFAEAASVTAKMKGAFVGRWESGVFFASS